MGLEGGGTAEQMLEVNRGWLGTLIGAMKVVATACTGVPCTVAEVEAGIGLL